MGALYPSPMSNDATVDPRRLDRLLGELIDTPEKLDVVACLHRSSRTLTTPAISARVDMPCVAVAEVLGELYRAGVVSTSNEDGVGWRMDRFFPSSDAVAVLVRLYELDRSVVLRRMSRVALHRFRAVGRTDAPRVIRMRFKYDR